MTKPARVSSTAVLQTVAWIGKQGFRAVPTHPNSKAAINREYVSLDYKPPPDDLWKRGEYGVGIVTGPRHHGPVDADLDCDEALFFATRFMPNTTATFGRPSKPRSHMLYKVDVPEFEKKAFIDPTDNSTILELRGDAGHQTIAPGSIHEGTGELIAWSDVPFPDVPSVSAEQLTKAARMIALATLITRHVWAPGYHNEACKHLAGILFYLDWPVEDTVSLIEAIMEFTDDTDKSRIPTIRATYRRGESGKKVSGAGVLRKQLGSDAVVDRLLEWAGSPSINVVQEYNDRFAVVSVEGKFRIADTDVSASDPPVFYHKDDFLGLMATDYSDQVNEKTGVAISKPRLWLANPRRRQYRNVDFVPGAEDTNFLNLWTGWAVQPSSEGKCDAWLELLHMVICGNDDKLYAWLLHWFANIVREPEHKSLTAPVIIGVEGAGKSLMIAYFGKILGKGFTHVTNDEHIHGRFNQHLARTVLMHSDEALYAGDKKHAGIIRSLITDELRIYEQKGIDAKQIRNFLRLIITSNEIHAAPVKPGDRRYTVAMMGDRKLSSKLKDAVVKEMNDGGPAALFQYLLDMNYDPTIPRTNIKNEALSALKATNFTPPEAWWYDALYEGEVLPRFLMWATQPENEAWPPTVAGPALYQSFQQHMSAHKARGVYNDTMLGLQLQRFTGRVLKRSRRNFINPMLDGAPRDVLALGNRMSSIIDLPSLAECREAFELYLGQRIEWPDDSDTGKVKDDGPKF